MYIFPGYFAYNISTEACSDWSEGESVNDEDKLSPGEILEEEFDATYGVTS